ncbi:MAG: hypothetical protein JO044_00330 [Mycobacteriaceae bacterium]|nr:hypothetical protein [Mycobacteriaceae bacterium]MBV9639676.1 hypothetical protein [Mycobacteriaceae bacterium]
MTTPQQQQPETTESRERSGSSAQNVDAATAAGPGTDAPSTSQRPGSSTERTGSSTESVEAATTAGPSADGPSAHERTGTSAAELFPEHELSSLRSRWGDVQAAFVDDPRECVQKADGLVADLVDRLTAGFAEARSRLEEQWARGEEVSTENLRVALKRYRDFFERLLAV